MSTDSANTPTELFHNLIRRVKESGSVEGVRFINAMGDQPAEKPITGYLAICEIVKAQYERVFFGSGKSDKSARYALKHRLKCGVKLMGKKHSSAAALQAKLDEITEELIKCDTEGYIVETEAGYAKYDKDSEGIFKELYVYLEVYGVYGEEV